jgi:hypothetical protein
MTVGVRNRHAGRLLTVLDETLIRAYPVSSQAYYL